MAWPATTFKVTGILIGLPPAVGAVMVTVPVYWPTAMLPALADTDTVPGGGPLAGVAGRQFGTVNRNRNAAVCGSAGRRYRKPVDGAGVSSDCRVTQWQAIARELNGLRRWRRTS